MGTKKTIEQLIIHFFQQSLTEDEMKRLKDWLNESDEHKQLFFGLKHVSDRYRKEFYMTPDEIQESKERLFLKIKSFSKQAPPIRPLQSVNDRGKRWVAPVKYIATAVVCICFTLGIQKLVDKKEDPLFTEVEMEAGARMSRITLPDGTQVLLNASTKLKFPNRFDKRIREVFLDGEACFDVVKESQTPFVVNTSKQKIRVLGTRFNVMDYSTDDYMITTLISGKIKLQPLSQTGKCLEEIELKPNQQVFFNHCNEWLSVSEMQIDTTKTWVNKTYHFREESLAQIAMRLEKIYGVPIRLKNEALKQTRCTGTFSLDQELESVLKIINFDKQFAFQKSGDTIIIQ